MNILYIHTHDSGRYIGPYGYQVVSPNIDRLGRESVTFRQCYCAAPTCSPSRAAMLTGMWPHENGMYGLVHRGFSLKDPSKHAAHIFREHGFETILSGIQHEAAEPEVLGYQSVMNRPSAQDMYIENPEAYDIASTLQLCEYIENRNSAKPFFASLGFINCHRDFPESTVDKNYVAPPASVYDCDATRADMAGYLSSVKIADKCVGIIVNKLKEMGLFEHTVILFTTDHGIAFPGMKCTLYDTGIGVACMLRCPGAKMNGKISDALISHIDILPTLLELSGIKIPEYMHGSSLVPLLNGEAGEIHKNIFAEITYHASYEPARCVRSSRYKLIRRFDDEMHIVASNIDNGRSKQFLLDAGILNRLNEKEMLFDLYLDPMERENQADNSAYSWIHKQLSESLESWMKKTNDPLLKPSGVEVPKGAKINKRSCIHAEIPDYE